MKHRHKSLLVLLDQPAQLEKTYPVCFQTVAVDVFRVLSAERLCLGDDGQRKLLVGLIILSLFRL